MDKLKERDVVGILNKYFPYLDRKDKRNTAAYEICQLFEPDALEPDESRLLTDREIIAFVKAIPTDTELALARIARREQDAKTASIKNEESQARVERIKKEIEKHFMERGYNSEEEYNWWQALKKREGVK